jgi:tetratricopeptide (TPR) repeat protein
MNKPELEIKTIRDEYFSAFGPAAKTMERYFDYWENYALDNRMRFIKLYWDVGWRYSNYVRHAHVAFPAECFEPAEKMLNQALEQTRKNSLTEFAELVGFVQLGLEHARLARNLAAVYDGNEVVPADRLEEAKEALHELVKFRKKHEHTYFSDLLHVTNFWEHPRMNLDTLMSMLPKK